MIKSQLKPVFIALLWLVIPNLGFAEPLVFEPIEVPVGLGAQEPTLFATQDGRLLLGWTEPDADGFAIKMAVRQDDAWGDVRTITRSDDIFVNWADFASISAFPSGTFAAHWLQDSGEGTYGYDVKIALSNDDGLTWGREITPHRDNTKGQHGFVTMLPTKDGSLLNVWLDSRAYKKDIFVAQDSGLPDAMQLRATHLRADGTLTEDTLLDAQTCTCCQTSAAISGDGSVLVAYRDRTDNEVRDISVVRQINGQWTEPRTVYNDGWEISGCPVNGPAIAASGKNAVVIWFTAADDQPMVKVAFSTDHGATFGVPTRVDHGGGIGRVDAIMLDEQTSVITWVEWQGSEEVVYACKINIGSGCSDASIVVVNRGIGSVNFPRMANVGGKVYFAWSQLATESAIRPDDEMTISIVSSVP